MSHSVLHCAPNCRPVVVLRTVGAPAGTVCFRERSSPAGLCKRYQFSLALSCGLGECYPTGHRNLLKCRVWKKGLGVQIGATI